MIIIHRKDVRIQRLFMGWTGKNENRPIDLVPRGQFAIGPFILLAYRERVAPPQIMRAALKIYRGKKR